jgi:hypothetical protein
MLAVVQAVALATQLQLVQQLLIPHPKITTEMEA